MRLRSHLGTAGVEAKGTLFLTNYRLLFVSTASVCTRVERRTTSTSGAGAGAGAGAGSSSETGTDPAGGSGGGGGATAGGDGGSKTPEGGDEDVEVEVALNEASGAHTEFWVRQVHPTERVLVHSVVPDTAVFASSVWSLSRRTCRQAYLLGTWPP